MLIDELLLEAADWEDETAVIDDPESERIPNLFMQVKKAIDHDGNFPIKFADGTNIEFPLNALIAFYDGYMSLKPEGREELQRMGIENKDNFSTLIAHLSK